MKKLNVTALTAIVAVLAAGLLIGVAAQADTAAPQSGRTRAEVKAELVAARASGELPAYRPGADFSDDIAPAASNLAGAKLKSALVTAQYSGELGKLNADGMPRRVPVSTPAQARQAQTARAD